MPGGPCPRPCARTRVLAYRLVSSKRGAAQRRGWIVESYRPNWDLAGSLSAPCAFVIKLTEFQFSGLSVLLKHPLRCHPRTKRSGVKDLAQAPTARPDVYLFFEKLLLHNENPIYNSNRAHLFTISRNCKQIVNNRKTATKKTCPNRVYQ